MQVRVASERLRFQTVLWKGCVYVMTRMGFGLNIAPMVMTAIVQWVLRGIPSTDSYIDDIKAKTSCKDAVTAKLLAYGLPPKPAEPFAASRVLGLQLSKDADNNVCWSRRDGVDLMLCQPATKHELFS